MNQQQAEEFAIAFKDEFLKNRGFDILCAELKTIQAHGRGYTITKITFEPSFLSQGFPRMPYTVTVNFLGTDTLKHERMIFYANFPIKNRTAIIQDYQILSTQP
jgi:hypothetical protein